MRRAIIVLSALWVYPAFSQESASFRLSDHVLNAGGHPAGGTIITSASHRMTLDALGAAVAATGLSGASHRMDASFAAAYLPPGEVRGLGFVDAETLVWSPDRSVGSYNLYRDLVSSLAGLDYGECHQRRLAGESAVDDTFPPTGNGYFYLVTARNRIDEEGTKGHDSQGDERLGTVCP